MKMILNGYDQKTKHNSILNYRHDFQIQVNLIIFSFIERAEL